MSDRTSNFLTALIGVICGYVIIHWVLFADSMTVRNDLVHGILVGGGLAVVTVQIFAATVPSR